MGQRRFNGVSGVHHSDARHSDDHLLTAEDSEVVVPSVHDDHLAPGERGAGKDRIRLCGEGGQDKGALIGFHGVSATIVSLVVGNFYYAA